MIASGTKVTISFQAGKFRAYDVKRTNDGIVVSVLDVYYVPGGVDYKIYTTGVGDNLSELAMRFYNDPAAWRRLLSANRRAFIKQQPEIARGFVKAIVEASHTFRNDTTFVRKVMKERLKVDDPLIADETQKAYPRYMPDIPYPSRGGVAVIKEFMEKTEPGLQKLSVDDQLDMTIIRELEQSGFFSALQRAR